MSRPLRLEFEGALYHVTSRGDRREPIYEDDEDRALWLEVLADAMGRFHATTYAYCLMGNHYHVVMQTHRANLSRLMRHLNGVYTQRYNHRHQKVGHLFQGRFKAVLVDDDSYFLEVCRYVELNPVRAGIIKRPVDWTWSSYRAHTRRAKSADWLDSGTLYKRIAPQSPLRNGPDRYAAFVAQGRGVKLWDEALKEQIYLGDDSFIKRTQARIDSKASSEIPRVQRATVGKSIAYYFKRFDRDQALYEAYREGGHTQTTLAAAIGLSVSRVSRLIAMMELKSKRANESR